MTENQNTIDEAEVNALVALALEPESGEPFTLGGRTFRRQLLTMRGERLAHEAIQRAPGDVVALASVILADQDPTAGAAWLATIREAGVIETLTAIVEAQLVLHGRANLAARFIHERRPTSKRRRDVEVPASVLESNLMSWAWEKTGQTPSAIRAVYSSLQLLALNDAEWWANYMPDDEGDPKRDVGLGGMAGMLGLDVSVPDDVRAAAAIRAERGVYDPTIGGYVDRVTGEAL